MRSPAGPGYEVEAIMSNITSLMLALMLSSQTTRRVRLRRNLAAALDGFDEAASVAEEGKRRRSQW
jgi:hypothetical protein